MPMKKYKPEQIVTLLRQIEVEIANGKTTPQACREARITAQTYYRCGRLGLKACNQPLFESQVFSRAEVCTSAQRDCIVGHYKRRKRFPRRMEEIAAGELQSITRVPRAARGSTVLSIQIESHTAQDRRGGQQQVPSRRLT